MSDLEFVDIDDTRRRNLELLIAEAGSIKSLGEAMRTAMQDTDPDAASKDYANTISQYRGKKPMGRDFARDLEIAMGKPKNWMDVLQPDAAENAVVGKEAAQIVMGLEPDDQEAAMRMLRAFQKKQPKGPNNPFGDVPKPKGRKRGTQ